MALTIHACVIILKVHSSSLKMYHYKVLSLIAHSSLAYCHCRPIHLTIGLSTSKDIDITSEEKKNTFDFATNTLYQHRDPIG